MGIDLAPPVLNISTFYLSSDASTNALLLTPKQNTAATTTTKPAFADVAQLRWAYANTTYTRAAISERGTCQAVPNYQWGFVRRAGSECGLVGRDIRHVAECTQHHEAARQDACGGRPCCGAGAGGCHAQPGCA